MKRKIPSIFLLTFLISLHGIAQNASKITLQNIINGKISFSQDGQFIGVLSGKNVLNIIKAESELLSNSIELEGFSRLDEIVFGTKNQCFIAGKRKGQNEIVEVDFVLGTLKNTYNAPNRLTGLAYSFKKEMLFASSKDGSVTAIRMSDNEVLWKTNVHNNELALDISYSEQAKQLASVGADGYCHNLDLEGNLVQSTYLSDEWVREVMYAYSGDIIVAGNNKGELFKIFPEAEFSVEPLAIEPLKGHVTEIALSPNHEGFLATSFKGDAIIYSFKDDLLFKKFREKGNKTIEGAAFNPNGRSIYTSSIGSRNIMNYDVSILGIVPKYRFKDEDDQTAPLVYISHPPNTSQGSVTSTKSLIQIQGSAVDESGILGIKVNGTETPLKDNGNFSMYMPLQMGENFVTIEVTDVNDNSSVKRFTINRKNLDGEDYDPSIAKNHLFIVGIDQYENWPKLYNAVRDAEDVANTLVGMYDFSFTDVKILLNEQASLDGIYSSLRDYIESISPQDNLVIYYSGHGHYDPLLNEGYWIPYDAKVNAPGEYLSNSNLLKIVNSINTQHTFMVVDACFSGSLFAPSNRGYVENVEKYKSRWGLASGRLETVSDGAYGQNSPFATEFLNYLKSSDKAEFPVSELVQYVKVNVANQSGQTPIGNPIKSVGDEGGEFIFRKK